MEFVLLLKFQRNIHICWKHLIIFIIRLSITKLNNGQINITFMNLLFDSAIVRDK